MNAEELPYAINGYPEQYDKTYIENPKTIAHAEYELSLIELYHSKPEAISWCDMACGTGWHLRNSSIKKPKIGVDREKKMIDHAQSLQPLGPQWIVEDILNIPKKLGTFDLVTHFWYGYIHQKTLDDVRQFFNSLVKSTSENGTLIVGICDPLEWSKKIDLKNNIIFDEDLFIDSIIWRYKNPFTNTYYANCIAPHPALIMEWLKPYFETIDITKYPKSAGLEKWQRYGYICKMRNSKII